MNNRKFLKIIDIMSFFAIICSTIFFVLFYVGIGSTNFFKYEVLLFEVAIVLFSFFQYMRVIICIKNGKNEDGEMITKLQIIFQIIKLVIYLLLVFWILYILFNI